MPIKYAVPAGSARTRLLTALAARSTGGTVRAWEVWEGLDTHPASQNSGRFGYSFGKTRIVDAVYPGAKCARRVAFFDVIYAVKQLERLLLLGGEFSWRTG